MITPAQLLVTPGWGGFLPGGTFHACIPQQSMAFDELLFAPFSQQTNGARHQNNDSYFSGG